MSQIIECSIRQKVPFHDVDPMQIVWHGNYLKYFEVARHALFNQRGVDLYGYHKKTGFVFPVTKVSVKYVHPLRFADEFICTARLREASIKIVLDFEVRLASDGRLCARATTEQVALSTPQMELQLAIPKEIQEALNAQADPAAISS
ncbi:MAG: thioesterase family protein [Thermodesulfobacteriota bacterium]